MNDCMYCAIYADLDLKCSICAPSMEQCGPCHLRMFRVRRVCLNHEEKLLAAIGQAYLFRDLSAL